MCCHDVIGTRSLVLAGSNQQITAPSAVIADGLDGKADKSGQHVHANGKFSARGDAQGSDFILRAQTTDGTQTEMFLDGSSARMTIASNTTWRFQFGIVAHRIGANESASFEVKGLIRNHGGTTALKESITKTAEYRDDATWDVDVQADDTHDALVIKVTGAAAKTINWVAGPMALETTG